MSSQPPFGLNTVIKDEQYRSQHNIDPSLHILRYKRQIIFERNGLIEREDKFDIKIVEDVMHVDWAQDFLLSQDAFVGSLKENITASDNEGQLQVQTTPKDNLVKIVIKYRKPLVKGDSLTFWYRCRYRSNFTEIEATFKKHIFISCLLSFDNPCDTAELHFVFLSKVEVRDPRPKLPVTEGRTVSWFFHELKPKRDCFFSFACASKELDLIKITIWFLSAIAVGVIGNLAYYLFSKLF